MKKATIFLLGLALVGLVGRIATQIIATNMVAKAELIQRITPAEKEIAALTGDVGEPLGPPQMMIVNDEKAFLAQKGKEGQRLVDDAYLQKHGIYPLQVKTVNYVAGLVGYAFLAIFLLGLIAGFLVERRPSKLATPKQNPSA